MFSIRLVTQVLKWKQFVFIFHISSLWINKHKSLCGNQIVYFVSSLCNSQTSGFCAITYFLYMPMWTFILN